MRRILTTATLAAITLTSLIAASDPARPAFATPTITHPTNAAGYVTDGTPQNDDAHCVGSPQQIGVCMAARRWPSSAWSCIDSIVTPESGWNPLATNRDGAHGLPQALPGSKMAAAGPDWWGNPRTQLTWLYDDYLPRYGGPCPAAAFRARHGWY